MTPRLCPGSILHQAPAISWLPAEMDGSWHRPQAAVQQCSFMPLTYILAPRYTDQGWEREGAWLWGKELALGKAQSPLSICSRRGGGEAGVGKMAVVKEPTSLCRLQPTPMQCAHCCLRAAVRHYNLQQEQDDCLVRYHIQTPSILRVLI